MIDHRNDTLLRRQTDPVWLQDQYLATGHTEKTNSATFTFIKRKGRIYGVTCGHVVDQLHSQRSNPRAFQPSLALHVNDTVLNLSEVTNIGHITQITRPARKIGEHRDIDIAIALLPLNYWSLLAGKKNKTAIDLDAWREPEWNEIRMCIATGYPNNRKKCVQQGSRDMVAVDFLRASVESSSKLGSHQQFITLSSKLDEPHRFYFSGMSGGAVYAQNGDKEHTEDENLLPIGIIFEGHPSRELKPNETGTEPSVAFLNDHDIFFRALTLTPETFDHWLSILE